MFDETVLDADVTVVPAPKGGRSLRIALALLGAGVSLTVAVALFGGILRQAPNGVSAVEAPTATNTRSASTPAPAMATIDWAAVRYLVALAQPTATSTPVPPTPEPQVDVQAPASEPAAPASQEAAPAVPAQAVGCPAQGIGGFALDLFNAINAERARFGVPQLAADGCVAYLAQVRSNDMANLGYFAHQSPSGQTAFSLLDAYGVPSGWAGENLARNNYPPAETVAVAIRDLMASPAHRDNILSVNYSAMGVAMTLDGTGIYYYTMIFVGPA